MNFGHYLGQHFLTNKKIIEDIVSAAQISKQNTILEVGPGRGVLTEALSIKAKKIIAVEKDKNLVQFLKERFKSKKNINIVEGDILKIRLDSGHSGANLGHLGRYKIVANIPYYITSRFLRLFLSQARLRPSLMVLMVQREVAERIVAKDKKESLLSLSVKAYGKPEIIKIVRKGNFSPPPKVDSAIIKITTSPPNPLSLVRRGGEEKRYHFFSWG